MIRGASISRSSKKKMLMVLSSSEAQYVVASYAACQAVWIEILLEELKIMEPKKRSCLSITTQLLACEIIMHVMVEVST